MVKMLLLLGMTVAAVAENDGDSLLQTSSLVGTQGERMVAAVANRGKDTICVDVAAGGVAPMTGSFTAMMSYEAVGMAAGAITERAGSFCAPKQEVLFLQRTLGLHTAQEFEAALGRKKESGTTTTTTTTTVSPPQTFSCDHECVKTEAKLQKADVITSLDNIKYSIEVVFQDVHSDSGDACGKTNLTFPPYRVVANPSLGTKITTAETRKEPSIVFQCKPGNTYHLLMADALGGAWQNIKNYNHWLKLNLVCPQSGLAKVQNNGRDVTQGIQEQLIKVSQLYQIPVSTEPKVIGSFSGKGYLNPAFPFNALHHFGFYIYETAQAFTDDELDQIDVDFPQHNPLASEGGPAADVVEQVASFLKFTSTPVAFTWIDVTTSYWSVVFQQRVAAIYPVFENLDFYKLGCTCNKADSFPGNYVNGNSDCNK